MKSNNNEKSLWFPEPYQIFVKKNSSYIKSAFIGLTNPLWILPMMILMLVLLPMFRGVMAIIIYWIKTPIYGLSGYLTGLPVPKPEIKVFVNGERKQ